LTHIHVHVLNTRNREFYSVTFNLVILSEYFGSLFKIAHLDISVPSAKVSSLKKEELYLLNALQAIVMAQSKLEQLRSEAYLLIVVLLLRDTCKV
jgi:hypothetical protein